ncbi:MAG: hypothetical protein CFH33_00194 [Alphaproteobacteria bacterium MarineAlpha9_Bin3]|nr:MAG: hypothetical protein CFH33_00194 [Alphaproteobacteria bacterium MarineAlpha9_Bin3]|tara:strand:+ start:1623 stop:2498 length:876 start_codon:yes stop_codon:yes gene_type:complete
MQLKAEELSSQISSLYIKADRIANTIWEGFHNRNKDGVGDNFWQFRKYEYGDPAHLIDWKKTAKSNETFIQEKELQTLQNFFIWRDTSESMNFSSLDKVNTKLYRANLLTLTLTIILSKSGENIALNGINSKLFKGKEAINFISNQITEKVIDNYKSVPNLNDIKNNSYVILIGDFLNNIKDTEKTVKELSNRGINGIIIHILDPAEVNFPFKGRINFNGLEDEKEILIGKAESVRSDYKKTIKFHIEKLKKLTNSYSWKYFLDISDQEPSISLNKIYNLLANINTTELRS